MPLTMVADCTTFVQKLNLKQIKNPFLTMNYQSLFSTLFATAQRLGFHPTHASRLHETLLREGFPIASFELVEVSSLEGEIVPRRGCEVEVKFMSDNMVDGALRFEAIASLMALAERFVALTLQECGVAEASLLSLAPEEQSLTIAGECAVGLRVRMATIDCNNPS